MIAMPLNIPKWLEENSHLLKPPVNNYCVYNKDMTVMIVGGPNARSDFHINTTPEFFYQYRGSMVLRIVESIPTSSSPTSTIPSTTTAFRDIPIREGELFLLPPNTPHNPIRFADTVGIVVEQPRPAGSEDTLRWYCQDCSAVVHEASFHCVDLGSQIKEAVGAFVVDKEARKCGACGALCDTVPEGVLQP